MARGGKEWQGEAEDVRGCQRVSKGGRGWQRVAEGVRGCQGVSGGVRECQRVTLYKRATMRDSLLLLFTKEQFALYQEIALSVSKNK